MELAAARLVALTHFAFVAFLIIGGVVGRRFPGFRLAHLATIAITVLINLSGSDCPLTVLETRLLRASGHVPYSTGFISHYLVEPYHPSGINGQVNLVLLSVWMVPTALAYGMRPRRSKPTATPA